FAGDPLAGPHGAAFLATELADADAPDRRKREAPVILRVGEVRRGLQGAIAGPEPQILIDAIRIDDLARIHPAGRIPDRLELTERVDQIRAEHFRQELRLRL